MIKLYLIIIVVLLGMAKGNAQITPPYVNNFTSMSDTAGWTHYSLSGNDSWEYGIPRGFKLNSSFFPPYVWASNLKGSYSSFSKLYLEPPAFDLSDTSTTYRLVFSHQTYIHPSNGGNIEFSTDDGQTWHLLNGASTDKIDWYNNSSSNALNGEPAWSYSNYSEFKISYHSLDTFSGEPNVKFRFKLGGQTSSNYEGWVIDHFKVEENTPNAYPVHSEAFHVSSACPEFEIKTQLVHLQLPLSSYSNTTNYYWSKDSVFGQGDSLIGVVTQNINGTTTLSEIFSLPSGISPGTYYIFTHTDVNNNLSGNYPGDNIGRATLVIDSIYHTPIRFAGDDALALWKSKGNKAWELKAGDVHGFDGAHSGSKGWFIYDTDSYVENYLESPHLNTTQEDSVVLSFWYRMKMDLNATSFSGGIRYYEGSGGPTGVVSSHIPKMRNNTWDYYNVYLPPYADSSENILIRIYRGSHSYYGTDMIIDDIYIGKVRADLSIEGNKMNRFTSSTYSQDTLYYTMVNSGLRPSNQSVTAFYWSSDSVFDSNAILLGTQTEPAIPDTTSMDNFFVYSKPDTTPGTYYIFYKLDTADVVDQMREHNNQGRFVLYQEPPTLIPYFNDFDNQINNWRHNASLGKNDWQWAKPKGKRLDTAFTATKTWITNDTGAVTPMSRMHLYTPVFNLKNTINPVLEFDMKYDSDGYLFNDLNMSYSVDGGATWIVLKRTNQSFNRWYYPSNLLYFSPFPNHSAALTSSILFAESERAFVDYSRINGGNSLRNTRYNLNIGFFSGVEQVQFRYNFGTKCHSGTTFNNSFEGVMIDNFSIEEAFIDLTVDYKKALMVSSRASELRFYMNIMNQGNYFSAPCLTRFYLAKDTVLDSASLYLGQVEIAAIRPDKFHYTNQALGPIDSIGKYAYLIYHLDAENVNPESNKTNNIGYWPLALDSISDYPYFNDFEDSIVNGWHQYSYDGYSNQIGHRRFRNFLFPVESTAFNKYEAGQMFSEQVSSLNLSPPLMVLETPAFSFKDVDKILLSFDLLCTGNSSFNDRDGGNMDYSTDGGNSWSLLNDSLGDSYNWYTSSNILQSLGNEPGWHGAANKDSTGIILDSMAFDASFLRGEEHVMFRFKYRSNTNFSGVQGLRLDNFLVQAFNVDYVANDSMVPVNACITDPQISMDYSMSNIGESDGRFTNTHFYWSEDSVFSTSDSLIRVEPEYQLPPGNTMSRPVTLTYPTPLIKDEYYVFYLIDADTNLNETTRANNVGSFVIQFDTTGSSHNPVKEGVEKIYVYDHKLFVSMTNHSMDNNFKVKLLQLNGKIVWQNALPLFPGENAIPLPEDLPAGIYLVQLTNGKFTATEKVPVQK